jgi:Protein of unknown function (DUF4246)
MFNFCVAKLCDKSTRFIPSTVLFLESMLHDKCINMQPFKLEDPTKPGKRTIAAIFLVDPNERIISTSDIPPQQSSWHDAASNLPTLFTHEFHELLDAKRKFPMSLAKAKELRLELMKERKFIQEVNDEEWFEREFSLCEH